MCKKEEKKNLVYTGMYDNKIIMNLIIMLKLFKFIFIFPIKAIVKGAFSKLKESRFFKVTSR